MTSVQTRATARILYGPGEAVVRFLPPAQCRGDGAPDGAPGLSVKPHTSSMCGRLPALRRGFSSRDRRFRSADPDGFRRHPFRAGFRSLRPRRATTPAKGSPSSWSRTAPQGLPSAGIRSPARGRRTNRRFPAGPLRSDAASPAPHLIVAPSPDVSRGDYLPLDSSRTSRLPMAPTGQRGANLVCHIVVGILRRMSSPMYGVRPMISQTLRCESPVNCRRGN